MNLKNVAIVGYGGQGEWHYEQIKKGNAVRAIGVYDIKEGRCKRAENNDLKVYPSYEDLINDPAVDIVVVATPNDIHEELSVAALNARKNVICEKPVTLSIESFDRIIEVAKKNCKIFSVHQNRRWDTDYLIMKQLSQTGEIGDIINIESRFHGSRGIPGDWRCIKKYGGGMLYDWGVHLIDQVLMVLGFDVKSVQCTFDHITNEEVDDGFHLNLEFKSGKRAFIEVGTYNFITMPRFYLRALEGSALIPDWESNCQVAKCHNWHEENVKPVLTASGITRTMAPRNNVTIDKYEIKRPQSDVHDFYRNFVRAIDGTEEQLVKHEESRIVLQVVMAAFESVEKQKTIIL